MKYLDYHKKALSSGVLDIFGNTSGLCDSLRQHDVYMAPFDLLKPTYSDLCNLQREKKPTLFWGAGEFRGGAMVGIYTPLRQNIVLLCAALNGEL